jgi:hypothetical protein
MRHHFTTARMANIKMTKKELPYDPVNHSLVYNPKESKVAYIRDTCPSIFIAALFTITKVWNQRMWPSMKEQ